MGEVTTGLDRLYPGLAGYLIDEGRDPIRGEIREHTEQALQAGARILAFVPLGNQESLDSKECWRW